MGASYPRVVCIPDKCADCSCSFLYFTYLKIWNYPNTWISTQKYCWIEWIIKIKRGQSLCSSTLCQTQPIVHKIKQNKTVRNITDRWDKLSAAFFFHKIIITWEQRQYSLARLTPSYSQSTLSGFKLTSPAVKSSLSAAQSAPGTGAVFLKWKTKQELNKNKLATAFLRINYKCCRLLQHICASANFPEISDTKALQMVNLTLAGSLTP